MKKNQESKEKNNDPEFIKKLVPSKPIRINLAGI